MQIQSAQVRWNAVMMSIRVSTHHFQLPFSMMPSFFSTVRRRQRNDPTETVRRGVMCDTASLRLMTCILIQEVRDWNRQSEDVFGCLFFFPPLWVNTKPIQNRFYRMFSHRGTRTWSQHAWPWNPVHSISENTSTSQQNNSMGAWMCCTTVRRYNRAAVNIHKCSLADVTSFFVCALEVYAWKQSCLVWKHLKSSCCLLLPLVPLLWFLLFSHAEQQWPPITPHNVLPLNGRIG